MDSAERDDAMQKRQGPVSWEGTYFRPKPAQAMFFCRLAPKKLSPGCHRTSNCFEVAAGLKFEYNFRFENFFDCQNSRPNCLKQRFCWLENYLSFRWKLYSFQKVMAIFQK